MARRHAVSTVVGPIPFRRTTVRASFCSLIEETYRYAGDMKLLRSLWPSALKAHAYMESCVCRNEPRRTRLMIAVCSTDLMPASISHEGYSAKPMHSYWDDFWALPVTSRWSGSRACSEKRRSASQFMRATRSVSLRSISFDCSSRSACTRSTICPGAAELGDFDATSTTIALTPVGEQHMLPPNALNATFERYWRDFVARRAGSNWDAYTPYEWRVLGTFIRLGWRERAHEAIEFFMDDRRPAEWNQWAEVVGREDRKPRFVGDMPHGWVASDFGRSLLDMFAYERPADETLALMAGVPKEWVRKDGFAVKNLRTPYGQLTYSLTVNDNERTLEVAALQNLPAGGIAVAWPEGSEALGTSNDRIGHRRAGLVTSCGSANCHSRSPSPNDAPAHSNSTAPFGRDHLRVETRARLRRALERVDSSRARCRSASRSRSAHSKIVEQRPHEIAANVGALLDGVVDGTQMLAQIVDAQRILEEFAFDLRRIEERSTVLGDVQRWIAVAILDPQQRVGQTLREHFPTRLGVRVLLLFDAARAHRPRCWIVLRDADACSSSRR